MGAAVGIGSIPDGCAGSVRAFLRALGEANSSRTPEGRRESSHAASRIMERVSSCWATGGFFIPHVANRRRFYLTVDLFHIKPHTHGLNFAFFSPFCSIHRVFK